MIAIWKAMTSAAASMRGRRGRKIRNDGDELDDERRAGRCREQPMRELRRVPGERRGQRLRPEVIVERRELLPGRVARGELDEPGEEQKAEQQEAVEPDDDARAAVRKIARKPASTSSMSHWKLMNSCPA